MKQLLLQVSDLLTVFSSETPLHCKLINTTIASISCNKVVILPPFWTHSPHGAHNCGVVVIFKPVSKLSPTRALGGTVV